MAAPIRSMLKFIDIGVNLTDPVFRGVYHGSRKHDDDLQEVLQRAFDVGMKKMLITGGNLQESREAMKFASTNQRLFSTVGCHPTRCKDFEKENNPKSYLSSLIKLAQDNRENIVAIGECGLDYDRLHFCPKETQLKYFEYQFEAAEATGLPLFLHSRSCHYDFMDIFRRNKDKFRGGVVHSFTGSIAEAKDYLDAGLYVGINGCSLKTQENIDAMCTIPSDKLMLETDAPWCDIRPTHAGHKYVKTTFPTKKKEKWEKGHCVKSRNEPANIIQVLEVISAARGEDPKLLADQIYENTMKLFFSQEK